MRYGHCCCGQVLCVQVIDGQESSGHMSCGQKVYKDKLWMFQFMTLMCNDMWLISWIGGE